MIRLIVRRTKGLQFRKTKKYKKLEIRPAAVRFKFKRRTKRARDAGGAAALAVGGKISFGVGAGCISAGDILAAAAAAAAPAREIYLTRSVLRACLLLCFSKTVAPPSFFFLIGLTANFSCCYRDGKFFFFFFLQVTGKFYCLT